MLGLVGGWAPCPNFECENYRQTSWGLHQRTWSNAKLQRRLRHESAWIQTVFLSEQRGATDFVETEAGQAADDILHDARTRLKLSSHAREVSAPLHRCACMGVCAFFYGEFVIHSDRCLTTMHVQVCTLIRCCDISVHICVHASCRMCTCAHVCAFCSFSVGGRGWGGSGSLEGLVTWRVGLFLIWECLLKIKLSKRSKKQ